MALRLNTLLHEMKLGPTADMTTRDQLEALFRAEIDRMTDHLDTLAFAARCRTGKVLALPALRPQRGHWDIFYNPGSGYFVFGMLQKPKITSRGKPD